MGYPNFLAISDNQNYSFQAISKHQAHNVHVFSRKYFGGILRKSSKNQHLKYAITRLVSLTKYYSQKNCFQSKNNPPFMEIWGLVSLTKSLETE